MQETDPNAVEIDLERLVARYGRKLAQAELEAEVAELRAIRAENRAGELAAQVDELAARLATYETDVEIEERTDG